MTTLSPVPAPAPVDESLVERVADLRRRILGEVRKRVVGQDEAVELALIALFAGGHSLIVGVPGLAKTLLVHTLAQTVDLKFARIQFTPDLMPSDITGTDLLQEDAERGTRKLVFSPGPIFANVVLADEINRTPPKTQAALLEAMQERRVTVQGITYKLDEPFFVFATQNPIELEGTYPLPEAQLDRFMFEIVIGYLPEDEEVSVVQTTTALAGEEPRAVVSGDELREFQALVRQVHVAEPVARYAVRLARASRPGQDAPDAVRKYLTFGASVRAAQFLVLGGKARALLQGRAHVGFEDVRALARPVLRHRLLPNFHARAEGVTTDDVVARIVEAVAVPRSGL
ncbi:MAG: AAA family ATPase [Gemmatimonadaceae bacterium]